MNEKIRKIRDHYLPLIKSRRANHEVLDWAAQQTQFMRFSVLADNVPLSGLTLLDVGCGLGDLAEYLCGRGVTLGRYAGVDILPEMLTRARRYKPELELFEGNIFSMSRQNSLDLLRAEKPFDVVYCSGALNLNLGNNEEFIMAAVRKMAELAGKWLVFNCLHARCNMNDPKYYAYWPEKAIAAARAACPAGEIKLLEDYLENDFTVIIKLEKNCRL